MVGVVFSSRFFLFFLKNRVRKKYIGTFLIYFYFLRKKRKIKKIGLFVYWFCGNR